VNLSATRNTSLNVFLLHPYPTIVLDGVEVKFEGQQSLELFIYLTENDRDKYMRSELATILYGDKGNLENFRKGAIFLLPDVIKAYYVDTSDPTFIRFRRDNVWVDSKEFARRANMLLFQAPFTGPDQIEEARAILSLYHSHFLESYQSKGDGFIKWHEAKQNELGILRHRLFEQMIQFYLWNAALAEAQQIAEQWLDSPNADQTPLQYLIWIAAARQQYVQVNAYLEVLKQKEREDEHLSLIGMTAHEWRQRLNRRAPLSLQQLGMTVRPGSYVFAGLNQTEILGQDDVLREVVSVFTQNMNPRIVALTGLPGVGKTTLARLAAMTLQNLNASYEVMFIQLKAEPDFESILNDLLIQFRLNHAISFSLVKKQRYIKQFFQKHRCLVIVDEGNTHQLGDDAIFQFILNMLSGASILFSAQRIPDENYPSISVAGLKSQDVKRLLVRELPDLSTLGDDTFENIARITGGLPMGLNLVAGFLKEQRFRPNTLINRLTSKIISPVLDIGKTVNVWC
jgi:hypothetical protein